MFCNGFSLSGCCLIALGLLTASLASALLAMRVIQRCYWHLPTPSCLKRKQCFVAHTLLLETRAPPFFQMYSGCFSRLCRRSSTCKMKIMDESSWTGSQELGGQMYVELRWNNRDSFSRSQQEVHLNRISSIQPWPKHWAQNAMRSHSERWNFGQICRLKRKTNHLRKLRSQKARALNSSSMKPVTIRVFNLTYDVQTAGNCPFGFFPSVFADRI